LSEDLPGSYDLVVVGAGAAGLATAIFARRAAPALSVALLDSARSPGAKILVSGGGRCNVTNATVNDHDFCGGPRPIIRRILRAFPVAETVRFFEALGVRLHEEDGGKLFPDTHRSRDVLAALLCEATSRGVQLILGTRVTAIQRDGSRFLVATSRGPIAAARVVLATGGLSLPKTGSDGSGLALARALGHSVVPTTPALAPLKLDDEADSLHRELSGVAQPAELSVWVDGAVACRVTGPLLWTHFGISGPAPLDVSRHLLRARLDGRTADLAANFCPGDSFETLEVRWRSLAATQPTTRVLTALSGLVPASVAAALLARLSLDPSTTLAHLAREGRRRLTHALVAWPFRVTESRGYSYAEVTAGGVPLTEIEPASMGSRQCPGLFLVGEILDVDGRIGGFNFQWAWSSAWVAGQALGGG